MAEKPRVTVPRLDPLEIWDAQPGEPMHWHDRFLRFFLAQEVPRYLSVAYNLYLADKEADSGTIPAHREANGDWRKMAARWNWRQRAEAKDIHDLREQARQDEADRLRSRARRRRILDKLAEKVEAAVPNVELELGGKDFSQSLKAVMDQERVEYNDLPETRIKHEGGIAVATFSDEQLDEMTPEEIYARGSKLAAIFAAMGSANTAFTSRDERLRTSGETDE